MTVNNAIVISDLHCGCRVGLCPPGVPIDDGAPHPLGKVQTAIWRWWREFWDDWVPRVTRGEPYVIVVNGDSTDGRHHGAVSQFTQNKSDQQDVAVAALRPETDKAECVGLYMIRGTEAHVGQSGENESMLAQALGAIPDQQGRRARNDLWLRIGHGLAHFAHHIGTTGRAAYETSAVMAELIEMYTEAAKWGDEPPDVVVRSHRHRMVRVEVPTARVYGIAFTTPGWQGKTPFAWKIPGGRVNRPQFGGAIIRCGDEELYTRHFTRTLERTPLAIAGEGHEAE